MSYAELCGQMITKAYTCLIKNEVLLHYPNFFFEKGAILYDYDNEVYIYQGFSEEELMILKEAENNLQLN